MQLMIIKFVEKKFKFYICNVNIVILDIVPFIHYQSHMDVETLPNKMRDNKCFKNIKIVNLFKHQEIQHIYKIKQKN